MIKLYKAFILPHLEYCSPLFVGIGKGQRNCLEDVNCYILRTLIGHNKSMSYDELLTTRGGEWYLEKRGSRKILAGSRNLGSVFDKSRSLVFAWFVFTFFESRNFLPKSLGLGFLTRISASRRVSDFTIRHPYYG